MSKNRTAKKPRLSIKRKSFAYNALVEKGIFVMRGDLECVLIRSLKETHVRGQSSFRQGPEEKSQRAE